MIDTILIVAENVAVVVIVVVHEQLAGVSVEVEVINVFGLEERNGDYNVIGIVRLNLLRNNLARKLLNYSKTNSYKI